MTEITIDEYLNNTDDYLKVDELKVTGKAPEDCIELFAGFKGEKLDLSGLDTSNVKDMNCFFDNCYSLKEINLTDLNTSNVKDMHGFFCDCESLKKLDLSSFNLENCKNTKYMFEGVEAEITASDPKIIKAVRKEQDRRGEKNQTISIENDMEDIDY